jgi:threonine/homoserine/homoserine lactone efflux protein
MLGIHELSLFVISGLMLNIAPGPDTAYIVGRSVQLGWRGGAAAALGIACGCVVHVFGAAIGLSALLMASSTAFAAFRLVGAAYLLSVGVKMLFSRRQGVGAGAIGESGAMSLGQVFWQGALTDVLNPKVALFFLAFLPQFVDPSRGAAAFQIALLGLLFTLMGFTSDGLYALVAGTAGRWVRRKGRYLRWERYVTGGVFIGLGVTAVIAGNGRK